VAVGAVSGKVFITSKAGKRARLNGGATIAVGGTVDTRQGRVRLTSAATGTGTTTQTADFYQGTFKVRQSLPKGNRAAALITDIVLGGASRSRCGGAGGRAAAEGKKKKVLGKLWGNGKGKFRTKGKYSSATVRGTIWLTEDRCDGTLTMVKRGSVSVRDLKRHKTVIVKAGRSYLARH
jgi:hypothetical protein